MGHHSRKNHVTNLTTVGMDVIVHNQYLQGDSKQNTCTYNSLCLFLKSMSSWAGSWASLHITGIIAKPVDFCCVTSVCIINQLYVIYLVAP